MVIGSATHQQGNDCSMEVVYFQRAERTLSVCGFMMTACTVDCCASWCTLSADVRGLAGPELSGTTEPAHLYEFAMSSAGTKAEGNVSVCS